MDGMDGMDWMDWMDWMDGMDGSGRGGGVDGDVRLVVLGCERRGLAGALRVQGEL